MANFKWLSNFPIMECQYCEKVLLNQKTLMRHVEHLHGRELLNDNNVSVKKKSSDIAEKPTMNSENGNKSESIVINNDLRKAKKTDTKNSVIMKKKQQWKKKKSLPRMRTHRRPIVIKGCILEKVKRDVFN